MSSDFQTPLFSYVLRARPRFGYTLSSAIDFNFLTVGFFSERASFCKAPYVVRASFSTGRGVKSPSTSLLSSFCCGAEILVVTVVKVAFVSLPMAAFISLSGFLVVTGPSPCSVVSSVVV